MKKIYAAFLVTLITFTVKANYFTPGTGVKYSMNDLVTLSGGEVILNGAEYNVLDTIFISLNDTLEIANDVTVKFSTGSMFDVNGVLIINPPNNVTFTAIQTEQGYWGVRLDSSDASYLKKLTMEYALNLRITDCKPTIDSCIFQYNTKTTNANFTGAIQLFRASPIIKNSKFLSNFRAAVTGGANISNAPKIYNCDFIGNVTQNENRPQINLGATSSNGADTVKIINNRIIGNGYLMSGGIGFLPTGNVYAIIKDNIIRKNRYGVTYNGGTNINSVTSYNVIDSNNIQNNAAQGGSGIAFSGGSASSIGQNSIVTGNIFRANLWGITIQGRSKPNLGNIANTDTTDDGKNQFINNINSGTGFTQFDLYNNTPDNIEAQNNYWNTDLISEAEDKIFHNYDNTSLGIVNYAPILTSAQLPLKLISFKANSNNENIVLQWQTSNEVNVSHFEIERSINGTEFSYVGSMNAINKDINYYSYSDKNTTGSRTLYYRLKMKDLDGKFEYSPVIKIITDKKDKGIKVYPNIITNSSNITAEVYSNNEDKISITLVNAQGQRMYNVSENIQSGNNIILLPINTNLPKGMYYLQFSGKEISKTIKLVK